MNYINDKLKEEFVTNKLIKTAFDKEFVSYFGKMVSVKIECYHLWLADLQNWFRENHKIHVTVTSISQESWQYHITKIGDSLGKHYEEDFYSYEDALENGLNDCFRLLT